MTKFCLSVDVYDVITCATFGGDDQLRGLGVARGRISSFPIDLRRRPYNTLALPCECVMLIHYKLNAVTHLKSVNLQLQTHMPDLQGKSSYHDYSKKRL